MANNKNKNLNIPGAGKGGGTLRAFQYKGRIHYWVEGYDKDPDLTRFPGAIRI